MKLSSAVSKMPVRLGAHWWMLAVTVVLFGLVAATEGGVWQFDNYKITD